MLIRKMTGGKDDSSFDWYLNLYKKYALDKIRSSTTTSDDGKTFHPQVFGK